VIAWLWFKDAKEALSLEGATIQPGGIDWRLLPLSSSRSNNPEKQEGHCADVRAADA
jgi:hypothetical protein